MIRRLQALVLLAALLLAVVPRGSAVMRCNHSGNLYLSGWGNSDCSLESEPEVDLGNDCCGACGDCESCESDRDADTKYDPGCCDLIGIFDGEPLYQADDTRSPTAPVSEAPCREIGEFEIPIFASKRCEVIKRPDPPGRSLRVVFASFLI